MPESFTEEQRRELKELIGKTIGEILDSRDRLDAATHATHHRFVDRLLKDSIRAEAARKRRHEWWMAILRQIIGWLSIAILTLLGAGAASLWSGGIKPWLQGLLQ